MPSTEVREAIERVREVHRRVLDAQLFRGYSGRARALGGTLALIAAFVLSRDGYPATAAAHLAGWGITCAAALLSNYGALGSWLLRDPEARRDVARLRPALAPLPAILAGGVFSAALVARGQHDLLFGTWMVLFGLANASSAAYLPRVAWPMGVYYLSGGTVLLAGVGGGFLNPWPMGIVFFAGEWAGGLAFFFVRRPAATFGRFFGLGKESP
jgi:hypothetical protein